MHKYHKFTTGGGLELLEPSTLHKRGVHDEGHDKRGARRGRRKGWARDNSSRRSLPEQDNRLSISGCIRFTVHTQLGLRYGYAWTIYNSRLMDELGAFQRRNANNIRRHCNRIFFHGPRLTAEASA